MRGWNRSGRGWNGPASSGPEARQRVSTANVEDFRNRARRRLPPFLFEYIDGGACGEETLERNLADLRALALRQRVLRDVSSIDLSARYLGLETDMPIVLGPVGLAGMNARRGEVQAAHAAGRAGVPFCLSTVSVCSIEEITAASRRPFWFQLYVLRDRGFMRELLARALQAGCPVLVFTVDMPIPGKRYRDYRSGLAGASGVRGKARRLAQVLTRPAWAWDVGLCGRPHALGNVVPILGGKSGLEDFFAWMAGNFDPSVTWKDLEWIRDEWKGPLVIKGILDEDDARSAARLGADGVVVSNHGGRQLDGALSSVRALPRIAQAVGDRLAVFADGGVRTGSDVLRMLALGAKGVFLGRAWAYALAAQGGVGVRRMLEALRDELKVAMMLTGCARTADIGEDVLCGKPGDRLSPASTSHI
jgi:L-lactate dehydrogenase (cytochrome)